MSQPHLMPTPRQVDYARAIARNLNSIIPATTSSDRVALSKWISENKAKLGQRPRPKGATSKQVGYAERIALRKKLDVPRECFLDATLMSRWIDRNK